MVDGGWWIILGSLMNADVDMPELRFSRKPHMKEERDIRWPRRAGRSRLIKLTRLRKRKMVSVPRSQRSGSKRNHYRPQTNRVGLAGTREPGLIQVPGRKLQGESTGRVVVRKRKGDDVSSGHVCTYV